MVKSFPEGYDERASESDALFLVELHEAFRTGSDYNRDYVLKSRYGFENLLLRYAKSILTHAPPEYREVISELLDYGQKEGYSLRRQ